MIDLVALLLGLLAAVGMPEFRAVDFGPLGRVTQVSYADLDGDGRSEVLVFSAHRLRVFRFDGEAGYDLDSPVEIELDRDALFYSVAQVDRSEKTLEIVLLAPRGVLCHAVEKGVLAREPKLLFAAETLVTRGQEDDLHWRGFLKDLSGDHLPDAILPTSRGYAVYYQRRDEKGPGAWPEKPDRLVPYTILSTFETGSSGLSGRIRGRTEVPDLRVMDFTGDGRPDLALDDGKQFRIFPTGEDGRISQDRFETVDLSPLASPSGELPWLEIRDVNGDRRPDYLLSYRDEGITDVFLAGRPLTKPAVRIKLPGWSYGPRLADLDGDGRRDLIIPTTPEVDVPTALSVMMRGKITVHIRVFLNTGDPETPFAREPSAARDVEVRIRLFVDRTGRIRSAHSVLVEYGEDFDGDGRKDLVYREGTDEVRFFSGTEDGGFATTPTRRVKVPDSAAFANVESSLQDLDGDGVPDLAMLYESRNRRADRLVLLLSGAGEKGVDDDGEGK